MIDFNNRVARTANIIIDKSKRLQMDIATRLMQSIEQARRAGIIIEHKKANKEPRQGWHY
jgi:hypothetical protein